MKRSEMNALLREATLCFQQGGWFLPPKPRWDITDFGLGDVRKHGLVLINLAEEPEYCEKLMYAKKGMVTPAHCHIKKKEDIICRTGRLRVRVWSAHPDSAIGSAAIKLNGVQSVIVDGSDLFLSAGERVTLAPGVYHEFEPESDAAIIGEVSTANDDLHDNLFADPHVGRFAEIEEDVPALMPLLTDR